MVTEITAGSPIKVAANVFIDVELRYRWIDPSIPDKLQEDSITTNGPGRHLWLEQFSLDRVSATCQEYIGQGKNVTVTIQLRAVPLSHAPNQVAIGARLRLDSQPTEGDTLLSARGYALRRARELVDLLHARL